MKEQIKAPPLTFETHLSWIFQRIILAGILHLAFYFLPQLFLLFLPWQQQKVVEDGDIVLLAGILPAKDIGWRQQQEISLSFLFHCPANSLSVKDIAWSPVSQHCPKRWDLFDNVLLMKFTFFRLKMTWRVRQGKTRLVPLWCLSPLATAPSLFPASPTGPWEREMGLRAFYVWLGTTGRLREVYQYLLIILVWWVHLFNFFWGFGEFTLLEALPSLFPLLQLRRNILINT